MEIRFEEIEPFWFKQYKTALRERNMTEWPLLKEKLTGPNSYQALIYLEQYLMARKAGEHAYQAYLSEGLTEEETAQLRTNYWEVVFRRFHILDRLYEL